MVVHTETSLEECPLMPIHYVSSRAADAGDTTDMNMALTFSKLTVKLTVSHGGRWGIDHAIKKKTNMSVSLQKYSRRRSKIILIHCSIIGIWIYTMSPCGYLNSKFWHTFFFLAGGGRHHRILNHVLVTVGKHRPPPSLTLTHLLFSTFKIFLLSNVFERFESFSSRFRTQRNNSGR